ncbi:hypothetical protein [Streptomyces sp. JJ38]|uniref:hypothetical protein n=1 Tax=Streptomyces sp. JJ38 TaxID=2738128 RepID=UPI001C57993F|nr:hypothetical protein [Streptomyces sp. JJ38]MBW1597925.1 hypothetical protein [Streptomyces sp. JJ38]
MRYFVGSHQAVTADDFVELALGTPPELWLGVDGESPQERAAREDAARDILTENPELIDAVSRIAVEALEAHTPALLNIVPITTRRRVRRPQGGFAA